MAKPINLPFNPKVSTLMHLDLNSCFASIEQQANPFLRGRPVAVAAYVSPGGCILAASVEAKRLGVKTGLRVRDGLRLCPNLVVLPPDPDKYRAVHQLFKRVLTGYTDRIVPKSIDEFVMNWEGAPGFSQGLPFLARRIKRQIKSEIGDWLTVSIGIAPNRFLAKTAAGLHKPDGLDEINLANFESVYASLALTDLCGIKTANALRLHRLGIFSVLDFYHASIQQLKGAFESVNGYYWYLRLHGYEVDDVLFGRKSYGNSFALPQPLTTPEELASILHKLVAKMSARMRHGGFWARGVHIGLLYRSGNFWHQGQTQGAPVFDARDIYAAAFRLLCRSPYRQPIHTLSVSCFDLLPAASTQLSLLDDLPKKQAFMAAVDDINDRWGQFVITPAHMLAARDLVPDRISFGGIKELEEIIFS